MKTKTTRRQSIPPCDYCYWILIKTVPAKVKIKIGWNSMNACEEHRAGFQACKTGDEMQAYFDSEKKKAQARGIGAV